MPYAITGWMPKHWADLDPHEPEQDQKIEWVLHVYKLVEGIPVKFESMLPPSQKFPCQVQAPTVSKAMEWIQERTTAPVEIFGALRIQPEPPSYPPPPRPLQSIKRRPRKKSNTQQFKSSSQKSKNRRKKFNRKVDKEIRIVAAQVQAHKQKTKDSEEKKSTHDQNQFKLEIWDQRIRAQFPIPQLSMGVLLYGHELWQRCIHHVSLFMQMTDRLIVILTTYPQSQVLPAVTTMVERVSMYQSIMVYHYQTILDPNAFKDDTELQKQMHMFSFSGWEAQIGSLCQEMVTFVRVARHHRTFPEDIDQELIQMYTLLPECLSLLRGNIQKIQECGYYGVVHGFQEMITCPAECMEKRIPCESVQCVVSTHCRWIATFPSIKLQFAHGPFLTDHGFTSIRRGRSYPTFVLPWTHIPREARAITNATITRRDQWKFFMVRHFLAILTHVMWAMRAGTYVKEEKGENRELMGPLFELSQVHNGLQYQWVLWGREHTNTSQRSVREHVLQLLYALPCYETIWIGVFNFLKPRIQTAKPSLAEVHHDIVTHFRSLQKEMSWGLKMKKWSVKHLVPQVFKMCQEHTSCIQTKTPCKDVGSCIVNWEHAFHQQHKLKRPAFRSLLPFIF